MRFDGWPPEAITWFEGLEADNSKAYFHAQRAIYDRSVRGPLEALLAEVEEEFGEGSVFRPNRDTRFSANKEPYKTDVAAAIGRPTGGSYYVRLAADGLGAWAGYYMLAPDQLERFRRSVASDGTGPELELAVGKLRADGLEVSGHEPLKTAPRGFPKDHPRIELLRHKDLFVGRNEPPRRWLASRRALEWVTVAWRAAAPVLAWFDRHVGPSTEPDVRRR